MRLTLAAHLTVSFVLNKLAEVINGTPVASTWSNLPPSDPGDGAGMERHPSSLTQIAELLD